MPLAGWEKQLAGQRGDRLPPVCRLPLPSRSQFPFTHLCKLKPSWD